MPLVTGQSTDERVCAQAACTQMEMSDLALIFLRNKDDVRLGLGLTRPKPEARAQKNV